MKQIFNIERGGSPPWQESVHNKSSQSAGDELKELHDKSRLSHSHLLSKWLLLHLPIIQSYVQRIVYIYNLCPTA